MKRITTLRHHKIGKIIALHETKRLITHPQLWDQHLFHNTRTLGKSWHSAIILRWIPRLTAASSPVTMSTLTLHSFWRNEVRPRNTFEMPTIKGYPPKKKRTLQIKTDSESFIPPRIPLVLTHVGNVLKVCHCQLCAKKALIIRAPNSYPNDTHRLCTI